MFIELKASTFIWLSHVQNDSSIIEGIVLKEIIIKQKETVRFVLVMLLFFLLLTVTLSYPYIYDNILLAYSRSLSHIIK